MCPTTQADLEPKQLGHLWVELADMAQPHLPQHLSAVVSAAQTQARCAWFPGSLLCWETLTYTGLWSLQQTGFCGTLDIGLDFVCFGSLPWFGENRKIWHLLFHFIGSDTIEYHWRFWLVKYIGNSRVLLILMLLLRGKLGSAFILPL